MKKKNMKQTDQALIFGIGGVVEGAFRGSKFGAIGIGVGSALGLIKGVGISLSGSKKPQKKI